MKKMLFIATLLVFSTAIASAQDADTSMTAPISHWSIGLKGGANYFRSAPAPATRFDRMHFILGGTVEYSINPLVGLGIELLNNPYGGDLNSTTTLDANTFDVAPYMSVNLSNLLSPYRHGFWKKVNVFSETGVGAGFYNYSVNNSPVVKSSTLMVKTGLNAEYNISKSWALGLEGQYRYYDHADMAGLPTPKGNCEALTATVGLRYKFGATKKPHARNISMWDFNPKPAPVVVPSVDNSKYDALSNRLTSVEKENAEVDKQLSDLKNQLNLLASRKETATQPTIVTSFGTVEFEFDSDQLMPKSFSTLDKMAELLKNASWSNLVVYGNTDNIGSIEYNQGLSERRADVVKNYLLSKGVSASKLQSIGNGELKPVASNLTVEGRRLNRRVEFEIGK
ncbi:MAG TPA: OmpA family protein [Bacteroidales bacterium]|nr:OmpA family protein [Bacteroidales bacterium]